MSPMPRAQWLAAVTLILAAACSAPTLPARSPTIAGAVVALGRLTPTSGTRPTVHVKQSSADPCGIVFAIEGSTRIFRSRPDGALVRDTFSDLTVGDTVRVWAGSVILDSCPGQAAAATIEIRQ